MLASLCLQAYPWVVRRILCSNSSNSMLLLRDILYDGSGNVKPTRLSALLNAALGYVADEVDGFVDFDAVPEEGASAQVSLWCILFLLGTFSRVVSVHVMDRASAAVCMCVCDLRHWLARQQLEQSS